MYPASGIPFLPVILADEQRHYLVAITRSKSSSVGDDDVCNVGRADATQHVNDLVTLGQNWDVNCYDSLFLGNLRFSGI